MDNDERYISIEQSIIDSFNEIREMEAERRQELYGDNLVVAF